MANNDLLLRINIQTGQAIGQLNNLDNTLNGLTRSVDGFSQSFIRNTTAAGLLTNGLTKLFAVINQLAQVNFNNFVKLESTIINISNLSDKAIANTEKYSNTLLKLSNDIGLSSTETALGVQRLLQAGITNQKEALTLLTKLQQFSLATGSTLEDVQNTILILRANFKLTGDDIDTALSQIAVAAARSRLDIKDFASEFGSIAGVLKPANITISEGAAFFALLADKLSSAAEASVSFKAMVSKIGNPTGDMKTWLDTINKSMNTNIVFSPSAVGKAGGFEPFMKNFLTTLQAYADKNKYAVADILAQMFEEVKSSRGLQGVVDEIVSGTNFKKLNDEIVNNTEFLKKSYDSTIKSFAVQFQTLGVSMNNVFMEFFIKNRDLIQNGLDDFVYFANSLAKVFEYIGDTLLEGLGKSFIEFYDSQVMERPFTVLLDTVLGVFMTIADNAKRLIDVITVPFNLLIDTFESLFTRFILKFRTMKALFTAPLSTNFDTLLTENDQSLVEFKKELQKRQLQYTQIINDFNSNFGNVSTVDSLAQYKDIFKTQLPSFGLSPKKKTIGGGAGDFKALPTGNDNKQNKSKQNEALRQQKDFLDQQLYLLNESYNKKLQENKRNAVLMGLSQDDQNQAEIKATQKYLTGLENLKLIYRNKDKSLLEKITKEINQVKTNAYNQETEQLKAQLSDISTATDEQIKTLTENYNKRSDLNKEFLDKMQSDITKYSDFIKKQQQDISNRDLGYKSVSSAINLFGLDPTIFNEGMKNLDSYRAKEQELAKAVNEKTITMEQANEMLLKYSNMLDYSALISIAPTAIKELGRSFTSLADSMKITNDENFTFLGYLEKYYKSIPFIGEQIASLTVSITQLLGLTKTPEEKQKIESDLKYQLDKTKELNRMYLDDSIAMKRADLEAEYEYNLKLIEGKFDYEKQKQLIDLKYSNDREDLRKEELKQIQDFNDKSYQSEKKTLDDTFTKRKETLQNETTEIKKSLADINQAYNDLLIDRTNEQQSKQSLKASFLSGLSSRATSTTADFYRQTQAEADLFFNNSESSINRLFNMGDIGTDEKRAKQQQLALDKYLYYQNQLKLTQSPEAKASLQKQMDDAQEKYYEYAIDKEKQALDKKKKALQTELNIKLDNLKIAESEEIKMINRLDQKYKDLAGNYKNYMIDANSNWINTAYNNPTQVNSSKSNLSNPLNSVSGVTPVSSSTTSNKSLIDSLRSTYGMTNEQFNNSFGSYSMEQLQALATSQGITSFNNQTIVNNSPSALSNPNNFNPTVIINGADLSNPLAVQTAVRTELNNMKNSISRSGF